MSEVPRKPRGDSVLKTLPAERQAEILDYFETHTRADTLKWLANGGTKSNSKSLSDWRAWYLQKSAFDDREALICDHLVKFKNRHPDLTKEALNDLGEFLFNTLAMEQQDVKAWSITQQIQLKRERQVQQQTLVNNSTRKLELELQKYKDQREEAIKVVQDKQLSFEEKEARMKQILGIK